jgi:hypothetical protein
VSAISKAKAEDKDRYVQKTCHALEIEFKTNQEMFASKDIRELSTQFLLAGWDTQARADTLAAMTDYWEPVKLKLLASSTRSLRYKVSVTTP